MLSTKAWRFIAVTFGWSALVGTVLWLLHLPMTSGLWLALVSLLYMPAPAVVALILERRLVLDRLRVPLRSGARAIVTFFALPIVVVLAVVALLVAATALLGGVARIPGIGVVLQSTAELRVGLASIVGPQQAAAAQLPGSVIAVVLPALLSAVIAGWTLNGVFALGEEYGWRGLLWEELRSKGAVRGNLLLGLIWGLWHAPLVLQGYDYPGQPILGIVAMIVFTTSFSFLLTAVREITGSVLPAAATHGAFNGVAVLMVLLLPGADRIIGGPLGLLGSACILLLAAPLWFIVKRRPASPHEERLEQAVSVSRPGD